MNKMGRQIAGVIIAFAGMAFLAQVGDADHIDDGDLEYLIKKSDFVGVGRIIDKPSERIISGYIGAYEARFKCEILFAMKGAISGRYRLISKSILSANDHYIGKAQAIISDGCLPTPR